MLRHVVCLAVTLAAVVWADEFQSADEETCLLQADVRHLGSLAAASDDSSSTAAKSLSLVNGTALRQAVNTSSNGSEGRSSQSHRSETHTEPSYIPLLVLLGALGVYALLAILYDLRFASTSEEETGKARVLEWDSVKLCVQAFIVLMHLQVFVMYEDKFTCLDDNPMPADCMAKVMRNPGEVEQTMSHHKAFNEWLVFGYSGAYRMPCFAFISGVFGQKVDGGTMQRVVCYTYGTMVMVTLLAEVISLATLGRVRGQGDVHLLWYLSTFFWWRVTLSPLFNKLRNLTTSLRLMAFALILAAYLVAYDEFGERMEYLQTVAMQKTHFALVPASQYFCLGTYFALGLVLPSREWTQLLTNKNLQMAGLAGCTIFFGAVWFEPYNDFLHEHQAIIGHWPVPPDRSLAFSPSRLLEHMLWLSYKAFAMFSIVWTIAALTPLLVSLAPEAGNRLLSGGARTMYSYTLHVRFLYIAVDICHARQIVGTFSSTFWLCSAVAAAVFLVLILTSRLTEKLLHHVVMPFWLQGTVLCVLLEPVDDCFLL
eukprot:TRINITY_DN12543_c0_g1_i3.p1 TRINITY_DN12543_c0_g1~~TRINITY_DN12543_c0_g1_i3.p1  ORF type:complete len:540 (-),score=49.91 TRINITY_DN12543_c0_g1_i3:566-2185(-)